jgi:hypothetical protein
MIVTTKFSAKLRMNVGHGSLAGLVLLALLLAGAGGTSQAWAFDQTVQINPDGDPSSRLQGIQIVPQTSTGNTGMELSVPAGALGHYATGGSNGGAQLPGLGALPKLDFGLELLYGAPDQGVATPDQSEQPSNTLTVHGSIKKNF